jgi:hypothetical protein
MNNVDVRRQLCDDFCEGKVGIPRCDRTKIVPAIGKKLLAIDRQFGLRVNNYLFEIFKLSK